MIEAQKSEAMKNLVVFLIVLAVAGTMFALAWYFAVDLPIQQALLHAPANVDTGLYTAMP